MRTSQEDTITIDNSKPFGEYTQGNINDKRVQGYDIARTFAIISVVLCHSVETAYPSNLNNVGSLKSQLFRIICFTIGRLGVPIFLFLTGALLLKKQIDTDEDILIFYKKNLLPLLLTTEIWNILYNILLSILNKNFDIEILIKNILFFKQVNLPNMWYMPMILGIYIAIPFIAKLVKCFSLKSIKIPLIIVFTSTILLPSINVILNLFNLKGFNIILDLSFLGGVYGLYILLGYYISNKSLEKISNKLLISIGIISFIATVLIQYCTYNINKLYYVWYNFLGIFVCSICIFELFLKIKNSEKNSFKKITEYISKISLGIFFMHEVILKVLSFNIKNINVIKPVKTIFLFAISFVGSIIIIYLLSLIKSIKKYIFLVKEK